MSGSALDRAKQSHGDLRESFNRVSMHLSTASALMAKIRKDGATHPLNVSAMLALGRLVEALEAMDGVVPTSLITAAFNAADDAFSDAESMAALEGELNQHALDQQRRSEIWFANREW